MATNNEVGVVVQGSHSSRRKDDGPKMQGQCHCQLSLPAVAVAKEG